MSEPLKLKAHRGVRERDVGRPADGWARGITEIPRHAPVILWMRTAVADAEQPGASRRRKTETHHPE